MNKYEKLIEHIINDEEAKARALFHEIVVEKSRDIYESLMDEEYAEEAVGGDQEGPADLLAAVEQEIAKPGRSTDNLRDVLNATFGSDRSPEFKKARAVIGKYLDLVDNAAMGSEQDGISPMGGGNIARHIQQHDLTDYLQHAAAMLDKAVKGPMGEAVGGDQVESMVDEIAMDETDGIGEGDDMDMGDMGDDDAADMGAEEGDLEQKVMDLESELEALKAEFEQLMGDEEGDMGDDDAIDMGDMDGEEGEEEENFAMMEADEEKDEKDEDDEEMSESVVESKQARPLQKTAVDLMREYVEKISAPSNTEGQPAGTSTGGDHASVNTKSTVAGKNDMGGTTQNIAKGGQGADANPDGTSPKGKVDGKLVKNVQEIDVAKRNVNKPGGNKGAQNWYSNKASAKKGEGQTTDGSVPVQKKSIEPGGN